MPTDASKSFYQLAPLEYFDPSVFVSENKDEQKICSFVLALALVYNDFSDLLRLNGLHIENPPDVAPDKISDERGHYMGLQLHLLRLIYACFKETMHLIEHHKETLASGTFQSIIQSLSKEDKKCWAALVDISLGRDTERTEFKIFLGNVRNKLASHYSALDPLLVGYKRHFFDSKTKCIPNAFISRGKSMSDSRFYFADAAVGGAFDKFWSDHESDFRRHSNEYATYIRMAIYSIVTHFIQNIRHTAWQSYPRTN